MRPKDQCYASLFDKKDLPYIYRLAEEVRITRNQNLINEFNERSESKWNDHNPILGDNIEFLQVSKADDLVLDGGIVHTLNLILGASFTRWRYMGIGTGTTVPVAGNTILVTEVLPRRDMIPFGWDEYASTSLMFGAIYGESQATITVNEAGVFATASVGAAMLNRNMFSNNPITHVVNVTVFVVSSIIEFVPVM
jgi:hypothetical protein